VGIVRTKGTKRFSLDKGKNWFSICLNLIPKRFGFYIWFEWYRV